MRLATVLLWGKDRSGVIQVFIALSLDLGHPASIFLQQTKLHSSKVYLIDPKSVWVLF